MAEPGGTTTVSCLMTCPSSSVAVAGRPLTFRHPSLSSAFLAARVVLQEARVLIGCRAIYRRLHVRKAPHPLHRYSKVDYFAFIRTAVIAPKISALEPPHRERFENVSLDLYIWSWRNRSRRNRPARNPRAVLVLRSEVGEEDTHQQDKCHRFIE